MFFHRSSFIVLTFCLPCKSFQVTFSRKSIYQGINWCLTMSTIDDVHEEEQQLIIPPYDFNASKKPEKGTPFSREILFEYVDHPERHRSEILLNVDNFVVIYDAYPKAKIHLLVIPKRHFLLCNGIEYLTKKDLPKIEEMHRLAQRIVSSSAMVTALQHGSSAATSSSSGRVHTGTSLLLGFHSVPSLHPLHLHLISDDFNSESLKNKKHWNSFTTDFFVSPSKVEDMLKQRNDDDMLVPLSSDVMGTVEEREEVLKCPLRCHVCSFQAKNIPVLKQHLLSHCS